MNEAFLYFIWKFRFLDRYLCTESGEFLEILSPGEQNRDSGPDFTNARLRIGGTMWAGNVEIHIRASDWFRHNHQDDPVFGRIILHVVYESDKPVCDSNGLPLQTLVVRNRFPKHLHQRYLRMMSDPAWIPCRNLLSAAQSADFRLWAPALAVERLEHKSEGLARLFESRNRDWEETLYCHLAMNFGFKINSLPFELMAGSLPLRVVRKHNHDVFQLEALLFGQSGMLSAKLTTIVSVT